MGKAMMAMLPSASLSAYESWALEPAQGLTAGVNDGPDDDPDHDGIVNLMEFVLGGNPMVPSSADPAHRESASGGGTWVFEYDRSDAVGAPGHHPGRGIRQRSVGLDRGDRSR